MNRPTIGPRCAAGSVRHALSTAGITCRLPDVTVLADGSRVQPAPAGWSLAIPGRDTSVHPSRDHAVAHWYAALGLAP